jgi:hypothetical protein
VTDGRLGGVGYLLDAHRAVFFAVILLVWSAGNTVALKEAGTRLRARMAILGVTWMWLPLLYLVLLTAGRADMSRWLIVVTGSIAWSVTTLPLVSTVLIVRGGLVRRVGCSRRSSDRNY